ncbi:hypothetical protein F0562_011343 [Nyssa sinensis]|uniref:Uncharacterized protein n=1 Tax=Nyssa sinensis TaxID=561372 RepID=A0A5J5A3V3_9ASTE|nr:hypothetical protein F0562_011343 [Nyssa sinensis]
MGNKIKMSRNDVDSVSIRILNDKVRSACEVSFKGCIFRVHDRLRHENSKAYEPEIVAIGPYHRGKENLQGMEKHKLRYLKKLLERKNESSVARYVVSIKAMEGRARQSYAESINLSTDEFVEMLVVDGFFIIELFRKYVLKVHEDLEDPIFQLFQIQNRIRHDLMLFENQLPLFILVHLMGMTKEPSPEDNIKDLDLAFLRGTIPCPRELNSSFEMNSVSSHLLELMHKSWFPPLDAVLPNTCTSNKEFELIKSTIELREYGINFEKHVGRTLLDIKFENGVMKIPPLTVDDFTENVFRNLIAYEQYLPQNHRLYVTDYVTFMDRLINSPKDAGKLCHHGIINNWLGDDEAISSMFNKLGNNVYINPSNFSYSQVFKDVNKHCGRRWNKWLANLRENYFNTPWTIISFLAAAVLLLLTLTQTIFSVLSYAK